MNYFILRIKFLVLLGYKSIDQGAFHINKCASANTVTQPYKTARIAFNTYYYIFTLLNTNYYYYYLI